MTLALIAIIVFLIVWGCQVSDINAKKKAYRERTKTNVALQIEIRKKVEEEVQNDLREQDIPLGEVFPAILSLYDEYKVAYLPFSFQWKRYGTREDYIARTKELCQSAEFFGFSKKYKQLDCYRCVGESCPSCEFASYPDPSDIMTRIKYSYTEEDITKGRTPPLEIEYNGLINQIVEKRMHELGYAYSHDYKTESDWQEQEKERKEIDELRKKYPYLFH